MTFNEQLQLLIERASKIKLQEDKNENRKFNTDALFTDAEKQRFEKYKNLDEDFDGRVKILADAKNGDPDAINYIFYKSSALLNKVFFTNFLGPNKSSQRARIASGGFKDFVSLAYQVLKPDEGASPLSTFDPYKFSKDTNILERFKYYYMQYLKAECKRYNKANDVGGISGYGSENAHVLDFDPFNDEMSNPESDAYRVSRGEKLLNKNGLVSNYDDSMGLNADFLKKWKALASDSDFNDFKEPKPYKVLLAVIFTLSENDTKDDICKRLDTNRGTLDNRFKTIGQFLEKYDISEKDLSEAKVNFTKSELSKYFK